MTTRPTFNLEAHLLNRITIQPRTGEALRVRAVQDHPGVHSSDVSAALARLAERGAIEPCSVTSQRAGGARSGWRAAPDPGVCIGTFDAPGLALEEPALLSDPYQPRLLTAIGNLAQLALGILRRPGRNPAITGADLLRWRRARGLTQRAVATLAGYASEGCASLVCYSELRPDSVLPGRLAALVTGA